MSAALPVVPRAAVARYITGRRIRRCFADGRGVNLVLEDGDALVVAPEVVGLLGRALEVRDGRRKATMRDLEDAMRAEVSRLPDGRSAAFIEGPALPLWLVALVALGITFLVFGVLGVVDGVSERWLEW